MLAADAELARQVVEQVRKHQHRTSVEVIHIGRELRKVRDALGHGRFGDWLEAEFGWTPRTAQNYMRAADVFGGKCETVSHLPPATLYLLSAKSTPESIVKSVVAK